MNRLLIACAARLEDLEPRRSGLLAIVVAAWLPGCAMISSPPAPPAPAVDHFRFEWMGDEERTSRWSQRLDDGLCRVTVTMSFETVHTASRAGLRLKTEDGLHWLSLSARHDPVSNRVFFVRRSSLEPDPLELAEDYAIGEPFVLDLALAKGQAVVTVASRAARDVRLPESAPLQPGYAIEFPWPVRELEVSAADVAVKADPVTVITGC